MLQIETAPSPHPCIDYNHFYREEAVVTHWPVVANQVWVLAFRVRGLHRGVAVMHYGSGIALEVLMVVGCPLRLTQRVNVVLGLDLLLSFTSRGSMLEVMQLFTTASCTSLLCNT